MKIELLLPKMPPTGPISKHVIETLISLARKDTEKYYNWDAIEECTYGTSESLHPKKCIFRLTTPSGTASWDLPFEFSSDNWQQYKLVPLFEPKDNN